MQRCSSAAVQRCSGAAVQRCSGGAVDRWIGGSVTQVTRGTTFVCWPVGVPESVQGAQSCNLPPVRPSDGAETAAWFTGARVELPYKGNSPSSHALAKHGRPAPPRRAPTTSNVSRSCRFRRPIANVCDAFSTLLAAAVTGVYYTPYYTLFAITHPRCVTHPVSSLHTV